MICTYKQVEKKLHIFTPDVKNVIELFAISTYMMYIVWHIHWKYKLVFHVLYVSEMMTVTTMKEGRN